MGFLSQVEQGQSAPSLASLRKIAESLEVSLFALLAGEEDGPTVVRRSERRRLTTVGSEVTHELLSPRAHRGRMELSCAILSPGTTSSEVAGSHIEGDEFALVLHGQVTVELGTDVYTLDEGDSIYFNSSIPHRYCNNTETDVSMLTATSPPVL